MESESHTSGVPRRTVAVGPHVIGRDFVLIAGPCAVESAEQTLETARLVKRAGAHMLRGGAFKPRHSPHSFQGLGDEGLAILAKARDETGLPIVTEVMDARDIEKVSAAADLLQVGSRNMQNYTLLRELGRTDMPVLLKRGMSATLDEWLSAAEYVLSGGNPRVILCERGIRTFETGTRNTLDLSVVPALKEVSPLPVIVDPSHATGRASLVKPMSLAAVAAGADGLLIEVHPDPSRALSDADQQLDPEAFADLAEEVRALLAHFHPEPAGAP
jgi:3-deoxy-7-phosphoheptulonate synthase